ncbi:MAG: 23S rRNA (adenine(2503)-C(2))-methyltransferase RlmN [Mycoplasmataceae bacterium]|jgi:23S rRNA (adenine2503-C2)-methyltransferase|nr:23S rRNA (adenine(2503)-C(2))-methyltransferase RlmN [Mycoplasmataceae bacterium]
MKLNIFDYTIPMLEDIILPLGLKKFNATQIFQWIYKKNVTSFDEMKNLSKASIEKLKEKFYFSQFNLLKKIESDNGETIKFLFELEDKQKIETVIMKFNYGNTVCISSQVGCNMGCKFCASGLLKKKRNLDVSELVQQVTFANQYITDGISNVVIMGIGEPFDNYDNLKTMLKIVTCQHGLGIGSRHITVSTCGIAPKIVQFANDFPQINLAISLHAPTDEIRNKIMPINFAYPLHELFKSLAEYEKITNRKITFEYLLLKSVNDSNENAKQLIKLVKKMNCYINIIPYNKIAEHSFVRSDNQDSFIKTLLANKIKAITRLERGVDINAACGQLRAKNEN